MSKMHHFTTRSQGYNTWGLSFNRQHGYYTPLVNYDEAPKQQSGHHKPVIKQIEILSPGICEKCHCVLPLNGKCDCK